VLAPLAANAKRSMGCLTATLQSYEGIGIMQCPTCDATVPYGVDYCAACEAAGRPAAVPRPPPPEPMPVRRLTRPLLRRPSTWLGVGALVLIAVLVGRAFNSGSDDSASVPPTPQPVTGATFAVNTAPIPCHAAPDPSSVIALRAPAGTVHIVDQRIRLQDGPWHQVVDQRRRLPDGTWQQQGDSACWVRTSPGSMEFFKTRAAAEHEALRYAPAGLVLYEAGSSAGWDGWKAAEGWSFQDGQLVSDGTESRLIAPIALRDLGILDYAVEVELRFLSDGSDVECESRAGLIVRKSVLLGVDNAENGEQCSPSYFIEVDTTKHGPTSFTDQDWHTLRAEANGNRFRLLTDGSEVASLILEEVDDEEKMASGTVGIAIDGHRVAIRAFRVIKLGVTPP